MTFFHPNSVSNFETEAHCASLETNSQAVAGLVLLLIICITKTQGQIHKYIQF